MRLPVHVGTQTDEELTRANWDSDEQIMVKDV